MGKMLLICFVAFFYCFANGQNAVTLTAVEWNKRNERVADPDVSENITYSKNNKNSISICDYREDGKVEKSQKSIIRMYDNKGSILASSGPIDLYDRFALPLGDNATVLVIFPAETCQKAFIDVYRKEGEKLRRTCTVKRKARYLSIDIAPDGESFVCGFSEFQGICERPEVVLYNKLGEMQWSMSINEDVLRGISVSANSIVCSSSCSAGAKGYLSVYDHDGTLRHKGLIEKYKGYYVVEFSDLIVDVDIGISTASSIQVLKRRNNSMKLLYKDLQGYIVGSFKINKNGTVIAVLCKKRYSSKSRSHQYQGKKIVRIDRTGHVSTSLIKEKGDPLLIKYGDKVFLEMHSGRESEYFEVSP